MHCMSKKKEWLFISLTSSAKTKQLKLFLCIVQQPQLQRRTAVTLLRTQMLQVGVCSAILHIVDFFFFLPGTPNADEGRELLLFLQRGQFISQRY